MLNSTQTQYFNDFFIGIKKLSEISIRNLSAATSCGIPYSGGIGRVYGSANWNVIHGGYGFNIQTKCDDFEFESSCVYEISWVKEDTDSKYFLGNEYIHFATAYSLVEAIAFIHYVAAKLNNEDVNFPQLSS